MSNKSKQLEEGATSEAAEPVNITYQLVGEDARTFNDYKKRQYLRNNAEAARKLMLERLYEVTGQGSVPQTSSL